MRVVIAHMEMAPRIVSPWFSDFINYYFMFWLFFQLLAMKSMTQTLQNRINLVPQDINQINNGANAVLNASDQIMNAMGITFGDGTYNIDVDEVETDVDTVFGMH